MDESDPLLPGAPVESSLASLPRHLAALSDFCLRSESQKM